MSKPTVTTEGVIVRIGAIEKKSEKFSKREIVINQGEKYPNFLSLNAQTEELIAQTGNLKEGERVSFTFRIEGMYWEKGDKYFNSLVLTEISLISTEFIDEPAFEPSDDIPF